MHESNVAGPDFFLCTKASPEMLCFQALDLQQTHVYEKLGIKTWLAKASKVEYKRLPEEMHMTRGILHLCKDLTGRMQGSNRFLRHIGSNVCEEP